MTSSTTMGVASKAGFLSRPGNGVIGSPVENDQATRRRETFLRLICRSAEYLLPPGSPPYTGHAFCAALCCMVTSVNNKNSESCRRIDTVSNTSHSNSELDAV